MIRRHALVRFFPAHHRISSSRALLAAVVSALCGVSLSAQAPTGGQFLATNALVGAVSGGQIACGDVDGDGDIDIVDNWYTGRLFVNDGDGRFEDRSATQMPSPPGAGGCNAVALVDVDGDGDLDIVLAGGFEGGQSTYTGRQNRLYLNDGAGTFTDVTSTQMPQDSRWTAAVVTGDVDGDGDLDLIWADGYYQGQNHVYLNDGSGTFLDSPGALPGNVWGSTRCMAIGDVDGDGDLDVVCGNGYYQQQNALYLNDGAGVFASAPLPTVSDTTTSILLRDVDGDGDLDLVVGNADRFQYPIAGEQNRLYLNDGGGGFTDATSSHLPMVSDATMTIAMDDVDGDGDLDLLCGDYGLQDRALLNDGSGVFAASALLPAVFGLSQYASGDVDGDGDPDLVAVRFGGNPSRILANLQRHVDAPTPPVVGQPFTLDVYSRHATASLFDVAVPYLSTARVAVAVPPYGTLGIVPMLALPPVLVPQPSGAASITWNVPNMPAIAGVDLFAQALVVTWPAGARLSNVTADLIQ